MLIQDVDGTHTYQLEVSCCTQCAEVVLWLAKAGSRQITPVWEGFLVWPVHPERPVPEEVPQNIAEDYGEAVAILSGGRKASAALSRRCLQTILKEKGGATQRNLSDQVDHVLGGLPEYIRANIDHVRETGNFAAHQQEDMRTGEIVEVDPEEAEWNLYVLDLLFDHYYVKPAEAEKRREQVNAKLKSVGKGPLKTEAKE